MSEGGRVLVVEDDAGLRETLVEILGDEGYDARGAIDGAHALSEIGAWEPEVIVLDVMMPRMDAFSFRAAQRRRNLAPGARILVVSAAHDVEGAADRLDADGWIPKPFSLDDVLRSVGSLLDPVG